MNLRAESKQNQIHSYSSNLVLTRTTRTVVSASCIGRTWRIKASIRREQNIRNILNYIKIYFLIYLSSADHFKGPIRFISVASLGNQYWSTVDSQYFPSIEDWQLILTKTLTVSVRPNLSKIIIIPDFFQHWSNTGDCYPPNHFTLDTSIGPIVAQFSTR